MHAAMGTGRVVAGRYRLLGPVGRGAMGIVWRGRDELLDRDVAVKQVQINALAMPADAEVSYQRTLREARTAARLSHPSVVTVFDVVEEDGNPWIIMELIAGRSLEQVIAEDGPLPPLLAAELGSCLLGALTAAHAAGILHRDVKPSNVLIAADGRTVLTDFGIATFAEDPSLTQAGMVVGTPGFTAPERVRGGSATPASDLWSLGATLYAAVEGRGPFERPGGSIAISAGVAHEEAPRAPSAGPLAPAIDALLRRDPQTRPNAPQTAALLADATTAGGLSSEGLAGGAGLIDGGLAAASAAASTAAGAGDGGIAAAREGGSSLAERAGAAAGDPRAEAGSKGRHLADDFLAPPDYAGLRMPGLADGLASEPDGGAGPGVAGATDQGTAGRRGLAGTGSQERTAGLPEFMDPPPDGTTTGIVAGLSGPRQPGLPPVASGRRFWPGAWRSGAACAAVTAIVVAAVLGFRVYSHSLIGGTPRGLAVGESPAAAPSVTGHTGKTRHSGTRPRARSTGHQGPAGQSSAPRPGGSGTSRPGGGRHSSAPAPVNSPTSTPSTPPPNGGSGGGPGGSGGTGHGAPPAGFAWHSVPGTTLGTAAGFLIAAPIKWQMQITGTTVHFGPAAGRASVEISLSPFSNPKPVREARFEQATALHDSQYPGYKLGAIRPTGFMGVSAAIWRFSWKPAGQARTTVLSELVTLQVPAGKEPYEMSLSVPTARFQAVRPTFERMLATFQPQP